MMGVMVGTVSISLPARNNKQLILADLSIGEFFGEMALLDGKPRSASAAALTKCELLVLERRDFLTFLERSPTVCLNIMQLLCRRIRSADERMSEIAFSDLPARLLERCYVILRRGMDRPSFLSPSRNWLKWSARRGRTSTAACANGSGAEFYS
jgi:CRP-like cAMP-binding protein